MEEPSVAPVPEQNPPQETPELSVKETIKRMTGLQEKDRGLDRIKAQIAQAQTSADAIRRSIIEEQQAIESAKEQRKKLLLHHKTLEGDVAKIDGDINKHSGELRLVKTNEAYRALLTAIENLKKKKDDAETKILELMDELDLQQKRAKEAAAAMETHKKEKEDRAAQLDSEKGKLESLLEQAIQERAGLFAVFPPDVASRYERLRAKREGVAVAPVLEGASCGGCRMHLTPQMINEVIKAHEFVQCERCQRILYLPP